MKDATKTKKEEKWQAYLRADHASIKAWEAVSKAVWQAEKLDAVTKKAYQEWERTKP